MVSCETIRLGIVRFVSPLDREPFGGPQSSMNFENHGSPVIGEERMNPRHGKGMLSAPKAVDSQGLWFSKIT